ncbi:MAG TPA: DUF72 domain-containing protein [Nitrososphaera sp.]|nr:DUF72 domain-containing protein [Nitrososphaera sp.]
MCISVSLYYPSPEGLESKKYLEYYSKVFNYVEIYSTFYQMPNSFMASRWLKLTPENFRFTAKFPKSITHDKRLRQGIEVGLEYFYKSMSRLARRSLCLLLQSSPSMGIKEGLKKIENLHHAKKFRYAVNARHKSWFDEKVYKSFRKNNICLVWNQLDAIKAPPVLTTDFFYIRFIGDRSIDEKDFGKIQRYRLKELRKWAKVVNKVEKQVSLGIVPANNHNERFGPATVNGFSKMVGLPEVVWEEMKQARPG